MSDEQSQHSDLIDDAIRDAEQQLEQKLEALRMSALGDVGTSSAATATEPRTQQDGSSTADWSGTPEPVTPQVTAEPVDAARSALWEDAVLRPVEPVDAHQPEDEPSTARQPWSSLTGDFVPDEPVDEPPYASEPQPATTGRAVTSDEEEQFWAQTRTALRLLQQSAESMPHQVTQAVTGQVEQIVREELTGPSASIRQIQQHLPTLEQSVADELAAPTAAIQQLQEELPLQLERVERAVQAQLQKDVSRFELSVADNVTRMAQSLTDGVERSERTVRSDVQRVEAGVRDEVARVTEIVRSELNRVGDVVRDEVEPSIVTVRQLQDELPLQFQRIERTLRESDAAVQIERLHSQLSDLSTRQREVSNALTGALRDELAPTRRSLRELLDLDLGGAVGELIDTTRATRDGISSVGVELDRDRLQRVEDLELVVDTVTTGVAGLTGAIAQVLDRLENMDSRMHALEQRLGSISRVGERLEAMDDHLSKLQPAPVIVTVQHPDAQVQQTTSGGFVSSGQE